MPVHKCLIGAVLTYLGSGKESGLPPTLQHYALLLHPIPPCGFAEGGGKSLLDYPKPHSQFSFLQQATAIAARPEGVGQQNLCVNQISSPFKCRYAEEICAG